MIRTWPAIAGAILAAAAIGASAGAEPLDRAKLAYHDELKNPSLLRRYEQAKSPKALAIHRSGDVSFYIGQASTAEASRRALENCEWHNKTPCVVAAIDDKVLPVDPGKPLVSAFAALGAKLDPMTIPFVSDSGREGFAKDMATRSKIAEGEAAKNYSVALHPAGWGAISPLQRSAAQADALALAICRDMVAKDRRANPANCFIFARENRIVVKLPPP